MLGLYFALLRIGAQTAPLNYRESLPELGHLSKCVDAEFLVCADSFAEQGESLCRLSGAQLILESELLRAPAAGSRFLPEERRGEDIVLNIFTGGTTGTPKAASHTNNGLLCQIKSCFDIESPGDLGRHFPQLRAHVPHRRLHRGDADPVCRRDVHNQPRL